jgi:hypothetical protein
MRFMMLVKSSSDAESGVLPTEAELSEMGAFNEQLIQAGMMLGGEGLHGSSKGARVRIARGKTTVTDGPFAEAKELVAGFWVIQAKSKAEVVEWAKRVPFREGELEVRPLHEAEDFAANDTEPPPEPAAAPAVPPRKPGTKRFMCMIKADKATEAEPRETPKLAELLADMTALMTEMTDKGHLLSGDGLKATSHGFRVKYAGDKRSVVDGPFTESKELIAGYSIVQFETIAEALDFSRRMLEIHMRHTGVPEGEVEVRQVFETEEFPVSPEEKPGGWRDQELAFRDRQA